MIQVIATYRAQDIAQARAHRDEMKAHGWKAFLTMESGWRGYQAQVLLHVEPLIDSTKPRHESEYRDFAP
jgi:hypothetical protein